MPFEIKKTATYKLNATPMELAEEIYKRQDKQFFRRAVMNDIICVMKSESGDKCAFGCIIPDELLPSPGVVIGPNGDKLGNGCMVSQIFKEATREQSTVITTMQLIHDNKLLDESARCSFYRQIVELVRVLSK